MRSYRTKKIHSSALITSSPSIPFLLLQTKCTIYAVTRTTNALYKSLLAQSQAIWWKKCTILGQIICVTSGREKISAREINLR